MAEDVARYDQSLIGNRPHDKLAAGDGKHGFRVVL
jgi:hypothetical protein